jgi:hypothetical protein
MIVTKKALPRRQFLRGVGVTLALPLLDAMVPSFTAMAATPANPVRRLGFIYVPMGSNFSQFQPKTVGTLTELSPTLSSLTPFIDQLTVLSNMELKNSYSPGNHATANSGYLSAARAKMTEGSDYELGSPSTKSLRSTSRKIPRCPRSSSPWIC